MYKLTLNSTSIIRLSDNACIPNDPANNDYAAYLIWAETNIPTPADIPSPNIAIIKQITTLEATITNRRLREHMLGSDNGWLASINDQITVLRNILV